jgi:hypothetical protein
MVEEAEVMEAATEGDSYTIKVKVNEVVFLYSILIKDN